MPKQCSFAPDSPGDDYGRLVFQFIILIAQKLLTKNRLNKLACTDHMYLQVCVQAGVVLYAGGMYACKAACRQAGKRACVTIVKDA